MDLVTPAIAFFIAAASPGPATLAVAGTAMLRGRLPGIALALGLSLGLAFWGAIAAAGFGAVLIHWAPGMLALRIIGGTYLLYLAWQSARSALNPTAPAPQNHPQGALFRRGLLLNLTNPKALLAWAAVIALGLGPEAPPAQALTIAALCSAIGFAIYLAYALAFSTPRIMQAYARARRWIEAVLAALFGAAGIRLLADPT